MSMRLLLATIPALPSRRLLRLSAAGVIALAASACAGSRQYADVTGSLPTDVRDRHPIILSEAPRSIDIYASARGLDLRQAEDLRAFAAEYRSQGRSRIIMETPSHGGAGAGHVRAALASAGVPAAAIVSRSYPVEGHLHAAPVRLSFASLQARVPHACGAWPEDTGLSQPGFSASNRPYWNLGCASQTALAAQVADPLDLVRGRQEGRIDTQKRIGALEKLRQGADPTTNWRTNAPSLNKTVGN
jgi:pilus assembly protein CpaD